MNTATKEDVFSSTMKELGLVISNSPDSKRKSMEPKVDALASLMAKQTTSTVATITDFGAPLEEVPEKWTSQRILNMMPDLSFMSSHTLVYPKGKAGKEAKSSGIGGSQQVPNYSS